MTFFHYDFLFHLPPYDKAFSKRVRLCVAMQCIPHYVQANLKTIYFQPHKSALQR